MALADPVSVINELTDNVKNYGKLTMAVIKNITSLNGVDKKDFNEGLKKFKQLNNVAPLYLSLMDQILDSFTTKSNPNNDIKTLLGYYENKHLEDNGGKVETKVTTGYAVIDSVNQIGTLIKNVTSSITTLADPKLFGFGSVFIIKRNIKKMSKVLESLCNDLMGAFKGMKFNKNELSVIFGEPESIVQLNDINKVDDLKTTMDGKEVTGKNGIKDTTKIITKKPKMGIIEGMLSIVNLIKSVLDMDLGIGKMIKFHFRAKRMKKIWNTMITNFFTGFSEEEIKKKNILLTLLAGKDDNDDDCFIVKFQRFLESLNSINTYLGMIGFNGLFGKKSERQKNRINGIFLTLEFILDKCDNLVKRKLRNEKLSDINIFLGTFEKMILSINKLAKISPNRIQRLFIQMGVKNVCKIIHYIADMFKSEIDFKTLSTNIKTINEIFNNVKQVFIDITIIGLLALPITIFMFPIMAALWGIKVMMRKLSKIEVQEDIVTKIEALKDTFKNLTNVFLLVTLCGALAIPATVGAFVTMICLLALVPMLIGIQKLLSFVKFQKLEADTKSLLITLGLMVGAIVVLYLLAMASQKIVKVGLWILLGFAMMIAILLVMWGIQKIISNIQWVKMNLQMFSLLITLGLMVAAIGILYLLAIVTEKMEGKWKQLFIALGAISVVLVIIIGFGLLLGVIGGLMAASTIGFGAILAIIVMIAMTITTLNELADTNIKKDKIQAKLKVIGSIIASEGSDKEWTLKYFMNQIGKGWGKGKRQTKKIRKMVDNIKEIVDTLNEIQKITLDPIKINGNLQTVYDVITGTITGEFKLDSEGNMTANEVKVTGLIGFITILDKSIEKQKILRKANQSLRKLRRTTNIIKDICDNLNEIMKFNIEPNSIIEQLGKIWSVIGAVQQNINDMMKTDGKSQETMTRIQRREERRRMRHERKKMRIANQTLGKVDAILEEVASIVDSINSIKDFKVDIKEIIGDVKDPNNPGGKLGEIFKVIDAIQTQIDTKLNIATNPSDKLKYLTQLGEAFSTFSIVQGDTEESTKFMGQIGTFIEKINTIDNTQLEKTKDIFKDMVKSVKDLNTNFEKLSKTMDKDIAKSLEKMNGRLEKSGGLFNTNVQTTSQTSTTSQTQSTNQSDMDNTLKAQLAQQLAYDSETLGYMEEIVRLLKTNKFRVITN